MEFNRFCKGLLFILLLGLESGVSQAETHLSLSDFNVHDSYKGPVNHRENVKNLSPNLAWEYKNAKKINFAGHYVLFTFGSGGGSLGYGLLDARSGILVESEIPNYYAEGLESDQFNINSSLVIIKGQALDDGDNTIKYFSLKDGALKLIKTVNVASENE